MKVLVTGAGALLGQGIIKSLRLAPTRYGIVAVDPDPRAVGLYWADQAYLIPLASDPNYLASLCQVIEKERPEAVLIGTDVELMTLAVNKSEIESSYGTHVIVSPPEVTQIANDKWLTYQFLSSSGFPHPRSALPGGLTDLLRQCDFPLIVKPRIGARSVGIHLVHDEKDLELAVRSVRDPIIQEYVSTPQHEYTSGVLFVDQQVRAIVTMRRDLKDGNTYRAYVEPSAPFNDLLSTIAKKLGGCGPLNFQFRSDEGVPKIFEINARFSGTTPLRAYAGFNEVDLVVRHYVQGDPIPEPSLQPVTILRYWDEIIVQQPQLTTLSSNGAMVNPVFDRPTRI